MVAVVDYEAGNVRSVVNALRRLGAEVCVTDDHKTLLSADRVVLPGVGHAGRAMADLHKRGLVDLLRALNQPVLGVCIGMQLMCNHSQEGDTQGLGIFDCVVRKIAPLDGLKVPHTGWNTIYNMSGRLFDGITSDQYVYYVHSYAASVGAATIATTDYGEPFSGALHRDNFYGTQFHPEKSAEVGERILSNFLTI